MKKILIVDDNELMIEVMTYILINNGYDVIALNNGAEVFNKIKDDCQININTEITSIRKKHNKLEIQTNNASNSKEYDKIITTIPLTSLIERCSNIETISDLRSEIAARPI